MNKNKFNAGLLALLPLIGLTGCNNDNSTSEVKNNLVEQTNFVQPYKIGGDENKAYIVDKLGNAYISLSTEVLFNLIKDADKKTVTDCKKYFELAKNSGFNTLEVPVQWSMIETDEGVYSYDWIDGFLSYAKEYDLKINVLWFGSITDGQSYSANIPNYVYENTSKYSVIKSILDYGPYGRLSIMDWSDPDLLEAESKAIYNLFNHIGEWCNENSTYPVVMAQIGQGAADRFARWRVEQYEILESDGTQWDSEKAYNLCNTYIEAMAKAIKLTKYRPLVRLEFCEQNAVTNAVKNVYNLEGVDLVCPTYLHSLANTVTGITNFYETESVSGMPILNVENWAKDYNDKQILATFALGGSGYTSYQLANPTYFPSKTEGDLYRRYDYSSNTFTEIGDRVQVTKAINKGLKDAYIPVASTKPGDFVPLGINNSLKTEDQFVYSKSGVFMHYNKAKSGIGFAICKDNYMYCFSTSDATLKFERAVFTVGSKGSFSDDGTWKSDGVINLGGDNLTLTMEKGITYRIKISSIEPKPTNIDEKYKAADESIRG